MMWRGSRCLGSLLKGISGTVRKNRVWTPLLKVSPLKSFSSQSDSNMASSVHESVKTYYSSLDSSESLQTNAACSAASRPLSPNISEALRSIHPEVCKRFFGCGVVIPEKLEGCSALDLGSGSGRDCYILSKLVGENGRVIGLDMNEELIQASKKYLDYHQECFGYTKPNTVFVHGYMEKLTDAGIAENSKDVIISNCVICLCPDKRAVLHEAYKVLKVGGELYLSDMYASKIVPDSFREDPVLWGEGMAGALYWQDFISLVKELGFSTPRLVTASIINVHNPELRLKAGDVEYASGTYRMFKLPPNVIPTKGRVTYRGTVPHCEESFELDASTAFKKDVAVDVDAETALILQLSRFSTDFTIQRTNPDPTISCTQQSCSPTHLSPFSLADKLGLCVKQCSKRDVTKNRNEEAAGGSSV